MSNKHCLVYETLGSVTDMKIVESASDNCVRLSGVFGVCGVKNGNNRIYNKENYGKMVENLQNVIVNEGCLGELEHPNTMNINLENVSHKIESIEMNEDGTITGSIVLLNTPKGQIAKAIVEGGAELTKCAPGGADCVTAIAKVMGVSASAGAAKNIAIRRKPEIRFVGRLFERSELRPTLISLTAIPMFSAPRT